MTSLLLTTFIDVLAILLTVSRLTAELTAISGTSVQLSLVSLSQFVNIRYTSFIGEFQVRPRI